MGLNMSRLGVIPNHLRKFDEFSRDLEVGVHLRKIVRDSTEQVTQHELATQSLGALSVLFRALGVSVMATSHWNSSPSRDARVLLAVNNVFAAMFLQWGGTTEEGFLISFIVRNVDKQYFLHCNTALLQKCTCWMNQHIGYDLARNNKMLFWSVKIMWQDKNRGCLHLGFLCFRAVDKRVMLTFIPVEVR